MPAPLPPSPNYVAALEYGRRRLEGGFPLSNRLIREIHGVLLSRGRGSKKDPGHFRRSQNWIGGTRPGNAVFVPPPHTAVQRCMGDLELFLHAGVPREPLLYLSLHLKQHKSSDYELLNEVRETGDWKGCGSRRRGR